MKKKICIGFFSDFKGEDSILISVDIHGLLDVEDVFLKMADGMEKIDFSHVRILDRQYRINLIAYCDDKNFGLRNIGNGKYEWRATKQKWNEFRVKLTMMYRDSNHGHHYLDSNSA